MPRTLSSFELWYGRVRIGMINDAFSTDDTWYGRFELHISEKEGDLQKRLCDFIRFSQEWNERIHNKERATPSEFDPYADVVESGQWFTRTAAGDLCHVDEAPVFFAGGELSWRNQNQVRSNR